MHWDRLPFWPPLRLWIVPAGTGQGRIGHCKGMLWTFGSRRSIASASSLKTQAKKVIVIIRIILIIYIILLILLILLISIMSQVRVELGITDHVWQEKRAAIAATVDELGDKFKPELRAGWLAHIRETYPDGPAAPAATVGEETLVLGD